MSAFTPEQLEQLKELLNETLQNQKTEAANANQEAADSNKEEAKESNTPVFDVLPNQIDQPMQMQQSIGDLNNFFGVGLSGYLNTALNGVGTLLNVITSSALNTQALSSSLNQALQQSIPQIQQAAQQAAQQKK